MVVNNKRMTSLPLKFLILKPNRLAMLCKSRTIFIQFSSYQDRRHPIIIRKHFFCGISSALIDKTIHAIGTYKNLYGNAKIPKDYVIKDTDAGWTEDFYGFSLGNAVKLLQQKKKAKESAELSEELRIKLTSCKWNSVYLDEMTEAKMLARVTRAIDGIEIYKSIYKNPWIDYRFSVDEHEKVFWPEEFWGYDLGVQVKALRKLYAMYGRVQSPFSPYFDKLKALGFCFCYREELDKSLLDSCIVYTQLYGNISRTNPIGSYSIPKTHWIELNGRSIFNPFNPKRWGLELGRILSHARNNIFQRYRDLYTKLTELGYTTGNSLVISPDQLVQAIQIYSELNGGSYFIHPTFKIPSTKSSKWPPDLAGVNLGYIVRKIRTKVNDYDNIYRSALVKAGISWPDIAEHPDNYLLDFQTVDEERKIKRVAGAGKRPIGRPSNVTANWKDFLSNLIEAVTCYKSLYGTVSIKQDFVVDAKERQYFHWPEKFWDFELGAAMQKLRKVTYKSDFRTKGVLHKFSPEEVEQLTALGINFRWKEESRIIWLECFRIYKKIYGNLQIPRKFKIPNEHMICSTESGEGRLVLNPWPRCRWGASLGEVYDHAINHNKKNGEYAYLLEKLKLLI